MESMREGGNGWRACNHHTELDEAGERGRSGRQSVRRSAAVITWNDQAPYLLRPKTTRIFTPERMGSLKEVPRKCEKPWAFKLLKM